MILKVLGKNIFLIMCMWNWKFSEVAILAPKIFFSTCLCACGVIGSFEEEICTFQYAPQFNWNWRAYKRTCFFNGLEFYGDSNFLEGAILAPKFFFFLPVRMWNLWKFQWENLYILIWSTVKLELKGL